MITESKSNLMADQRVSSKFLKNKSSRGGAETKSNTNRAMTEKNNNMPAGYKGMDGKTYKSFLEYRKNSEVRLKEMT